MSGGSWVGLQRLKANEASWGAPRRSLLDAVARREGVEALLQPRDLLGQLRGGAVGARAGSIVDGTLRGSVTIITLIHFHNYDANNLTNHSLHKDLLPALH